MSSDLERAVREVALRNLSIVGPVAIQAETGSTNDDAKQAARDGAPHGSVFVAESQSGGRGRKGRAWLSPPGENLLFSVLFRVPCAPARVPPLSLVCGLAVRDAIAKAVPSARVWTKWPNDVWAAPATSADDSGPGTARKVAGILIESIVRGGAVEALIVGVGLNVHTMVFPSELASRASSLALIRGSGDPSLDRGVLLLDVLAELDRNVSLGAARGLAPFAARLREVDLLRGTRIETEEGISGLAESIDDEGRLLVVDGAGVRHRIVAGDVHVVGFDGR